MIDFSALAAGATVAAQADFPTAVPPRRRAADPAFVELAALLHCSESLWATVHSTSALATLASSRGDGG